MNAKHLLRLLPLALLALAGGCATLSESECRYADWYDIGFRDGRHGQPVDHVNAHVRACGEHGLAPDHERYRAGHDAGLESFCTRYGGLALGQSGAAYRGVCVRHDEREFLRGFALGQALHRTRGQLSGVAAEIRRVEERLGEKDEELEDEERAILIYRRVQLEGDRGRLQAELDRLEWEAQSL